MRHQASKFESTDNGFKCTARNSLYCDSEWTIKYGLFEEDGINQYGVAMSATESTYANDRVLAADPLVKDGIGEEAMITVTLPYIKTAREGVKRLGTIVAHYGTSESNEILTTTRKPGTLRPVRVTTGWQRIPDDSYAVVANQMAFKTIDFDDPRTLCGIRTSKNLCKNTH